MPIIIRCFFCLLMLGNSTFCWAQDDQCKLDSFVVTAVDCSNSVFFAKIDLNRQNSTSDSFELRGNGQFHGTYAWWDLPLIVGPFPADGITSYQFIMEADSNCRALYELGKIECQGSCSIRDVDVETYACKDGWFKAKIDFISEGVDAVDVWRNDEYLGFFAVDDLPLTLELELSEYKVDRYKICVNDRRDCCVEIEVPRPHCGSDCSLDGISGRVVDCDSVMFSYEIDLEHHPESRDARFYIKGNGKSYGIFSYADLPVRLDALPFLYGKAYEFVIIDSSHHDCQIVLEPGPIDCHECAITDLEVGIGDCTSDSTVLVELDFKSRETQFFQIYLDQNLISEHSVDELPLRLKHFPINNEYRKVLTIVDPDHSCTASLFIETPSCRETRCQLEGMIVEVDSCEEGTFGAWVDIRLHPEKGSFQLWMNDTTFGRFSYQELPVFLTGIPVGTAERYRFLLKDVANSDCKLEKVVQELPCFRERSCLLEKATLETGACDDQGAFYVELDLPYGTELTGNFMVEMAEDSWTFAYGDLPVKFGPLMGGREFYTITIVDAENEACRTIKDLGRIVCDQQCKFGDIEIGELDCMEDSLYRLRLNRVASPFGAFDLYIDDVAYGYFRNSDLPLDLEVFHVGSEPIRVTTCVSDNTTCCKTAKIELERCENGYCTDIGLWADTIACGKEGFHLLLDVSHDGSDNGFTVFANDIHMGAFEYGENGIWIGPLPYADQSYEIVVQDKEVESCRSAIELPGTPCAGRDFDERNTSMILEVSGRRRYFRVPDFVSAPTRLDIVDLQGRSLYHMYFSTQSDRVILDLPEISAGMYILYLRGSQGEQIAEKFVLP